MNYGTATNLLHKLDGITPNMKKTKIMDMIIKQTNSEGQQEKDLFKQIVDIGDRIDKKSINDNIDKLDLSAEQLRFMATPDRFTHLYSIIKALEHPDPTNLIKNFIENYQLIHSRLVETISMISRVPSIEMMTYVIANTKNGKFTMPAEFHVTGRRHFTEQEVVYILKRKGYKSYEIGNEAVTINGSNGLRQKKSFYELFKGTLTLKDAQAEFNSIIRKSMINWLKGIDATRLNIAEHKYTLDFYIKGHLNPNNHFEALAKAVEYVTTKSVVDYTKLDAILESYFYNYKVAERIIRKSNEIPENTSVKKTDIMDMVIRQTDSNGRVKTTKEQELRF